MKWVDHLRFVEKKGSTKVGDRLTAEGGMSNIKIIREGANISFFRGKTQQTVV